MNIETSRRQGGFTLIELVVVIVVLGILAAFAIPRFIDVNSDARISSMRGLAGSISSATALAHGLALARGQTGATGTVTMENTSIDLVEGYPAATAAGIDSVLSSIDGFDVATVTGPPDARRFNFTGETATTCSVLYTAASATTSATVTQDTSGC